MSVLKANIQSLIPKKQPYPPGAGSAAEAVTKAGGPASAELASAIRNFEAWLNKLQGVLQNPQSISQLLVTDSSGKVIAAIGDFIFQGVPATNYFSEIHVGDPLNTGDPAQALFNANPDGSVTIGQHGWLEVLDPFGEDAAWIGTQSDVYDITGAVAGAVSGTVNLIRLTVVAHTLLTGDAVQVRLVTGVTSATDGTSNANGNWIVTKIDADHVDLQNSVFVGTYTSGGTISRILHVTGAADNGSGLIRLTVTAHGYESGDKIDVLAVGGVPNAIGQWIIRVIDANHFDLESSTFGGSYTSGGIALRYFAGGLFQTIAIGPSFVDYRLRAFADGTLKIKNAEIILIGSGATIDIDPVAGSITITEAGGGTRVTLGGGAASIGMTIDDSTGTPTTISRFGVGTIELNSNDPNVYAFLVAAGQALTLQAPTAANPKLLDIYGYTGATGNGPLLGLTQARGSGQTPTATHSGDTLGGLVAYGYDGTFEPLEAAGVKAIATEAHGAGHGTKLIFEVTPNGMVVPQTALTIDQNMRLIAGEDITATGDVNANGNLASLGHCNIFGGYQSSGVPGLSTTVTLAKLTTLGSNGSMTFSGGILTGYSAPT